MDGIHQLTDAIGLLCVIILLWKGFLATSEILKNQKQILEKLNKIKTD